MPQVYDSIEAEGMTNSGMTTPRLVGVATLFEARDFIESGRTWKQWIQYLVDVNGDLTGTPHYVRCPLCLMFVSHEARCISCDVSFDGKAIRPYRVSESRIRDKYTPSQGKWKEAHDAHSWYDIRSNTAKHEVYDRIIPAIVVCARCGHKVRVVTWPGPEKCPFCGFDDEEMAAAMKRGEIFTH